MSPVTFTHITVFISKLCKSAKKHRILAVTMNLSWRASTVEPSREGGVNSNAFLEFTARTDVKTRGSTSLDGEVKDGVLPARTGPTAAFHC